MPLSLTSRRHSIRGNCHRPNFGLGSPKFSTLNAEETPLFSMFEHTNESGESLIRSGSQKKCSKTLLFGNLSKCVFDISCSNTCQTANTLPKVDGPVLETEESSENIGQSNSHESQSHGVNELDKKNELSSSVLLSTQSREWRSSESLEDKKSKLQGTTRYAGKSSH